ncbi:hypothetical protein [Sphingomonas sp. VNH70]|uniref:hypothetical protein n=1 Tax=Sphingomonas silueang TaxID=3156617 RepID=UPI0032B41AB4
MVEHSGVENWGTARERAARRRRWKWVALAAAAAVLAPLLAAFLLGIMDGYTGVHGPAGGTDSRAHIGYVGMALAMLVATAVQYRLWRNSDEVERSRINAAMALAGLVALTALPVLSLAQAPLGLANPAMLGWGLAAATLIGVRLVQRLRG